MTEKEILGSLAESIIAIDFARDEIESAPADYFTGKAKKEFDRIAKMVEAAKKFEPGTPSEAWFVFLRFFMLDVMDNVENIKAEIESTFEELKAHEKKEKGKGK